MKRLDLKNILHGSKLPSLILYSFTAVTTVVFLAFFLVGFDRPDAEHPAYNAPQFTDLLIIYGIVVVVLALVVLILSIVLSLRKRQKITSEERLQRRSRISVTSFAFFVAILFLSFSSSSAIMVNGKVFDNIFWLKTSGVLVSTSIVMMLATIVAAAYGMTRYYRKRDRSVDMEDISL